VATNPVGMFTLPRIDAGRVAYYEGRARDPVQLQLFDDAGADFDSDTAAVPAGGYEGYVAGRHDSEGSGRETDVRAGRWVGDLAGRLGLSGEVEYGQLSALLEQRDPGSGERLGRRVSDRRRRGPDGREQALCARAGWDAQFAPPKSVSVLWAVGDPSVSGEVERAIDEGVGAAFRYLQDHAVFTRRGAGGAVRVRGEGLVAATYRHDTSRSGDPQYHVHGVIANLTYAQGRWLRLDEHALNMHRGAADRVFQAQLRAALTELLGLAWVAGRTDGTFEVAGVSQSVINEHSQRRAQILDRVGVEASPGAKAAAALDTRSAKAAPQDLEELRAGWRARAAEHGLGHEETAGLVDRADRAVPAPAAELGDRLAGREGLTRGRSIFEHRHVVADLAAGAPAGVHYPDLEAAARGFLERADVELVEPAEQAGRRALAVGDRFSTRELLDLERSMIERAQRGVHANVACVDRATVDQVLASRPELVGEQADMVRWLTTSGRRIDVVRAGPGTGKTYALDAAREAWQSAGLQVLGTALSARAAGELEAQSGIPSATIAQLRADAQRGHGLPRGCVLVVDEAGMVGTRDLAALVRGAERGQSKLVLVGDTRQLPEIETGGALRSLAERLGAAELHHIRRQQEPWDREAIEAFHRGDHNRWLGAQIEHGRVTVSATAPQAQRAVVDGWLADTQQRGMEATIMLADRRETVRDLNRLARDRLHEAGELGQRELHAAGRAFAEGERVLALRNHRGLGLRNGDRATVVEVADDRTLTVRLDREGHRDVRIPTDYLEAGHLDHGYAATVHKTQGATLDTIHYLGSDHTSQEAALVAGSRHRHDFRLYVVDADLPGPTTPDRRAHPRWRQELERRLGHSRAKQFAVDVQHRANRLRDQPTPELRQEADQLGPALERYATEAQAVDYARGQIQRAHYAARAAHQNAKVTGDRRDRRHARALDQAAREHAAQRPRIDAAEQALDDRYGPAAREHAARQAELERRNLDPHAERMIVARHDPDLQAALEDRHGPRPLGLAERDAWDTTAASALRSREQPRSLDLEPDAPDTTPTREWALPEPTLPAPEPDVGFDFDL